VTGESSGVPGAATHDSEIGVRYPRVHAPPEPAQAIRGWKFVSYPLAVRARRQHPFDESSDGFFPLTEPIGKGESEDCAIAGPLGVFRLLRGR
jgi:hypothetical protein